MEHPSRLSLAAATLTALTALTTLSACGSQDDVAAEDPGSSGSGGSTGSTGSATTATPGADGRGGGPVTSSPTPAAEADLSVEIAGDEVSPNAAELEVGVGGSITVTVASDRAGELHVHSTPEQYVGFGAGDTSQELTFQTPGTVEVEDHDTGAVVAFVEVR